MDLGRSSPKSSVVTATWDEHNCLYSGFMSALISSLLLRYKSCCGKPVKLTASNSFHSAPVRSIFSGVLLNFADKNKQASDITAFSKYF